MAKSEHAELFILDVKEKHLTRLRLINISKHILLTAQLFIHAVENSQRCEINFSMRSNYRMTLESSGKISRG